MSNDWGIGAERGFQFVHVKFEPLWRYVDAVRDFCRFFTQATLPVDGAGDRIGMVVHELIENAIRHGDDRELELELRIEHHERSVMVSVANTVTEEQGINLIRVFETLEELPAKEAYLRAIRRATTAPAGTSGLGLARARHEGRVGLQLVVSDGRAQVVARGTL